MKQYKKLTMSVVTFVGDLITTSGDNQLPWVDVQIGNFGL